MSYRERWTLVAVGALAALGFTVLAIKSSPAITAIATVVSLVAEGPKVLRFVKERWQAEATSPAGSEIPPLPSGTSPQPSLHPDAGFPRPGASRFVLVFGVGAALGTVAGLVIANEGGTESAVGEEATISTTVAATSPVTTTGTTITSTVTSTTSGSPDVEGDPSGTEDHQRRAEPLPGDDWNPEARAEFVRRCTTSDEPLPAGFEDFNRQEDCPCVYDYMAEVVTFEDFNKGVTGEDDMAAGYEILAAFTYCSMSAA